MKGVLVDANVILDLFLDDPRWAAWSESTLEDLSQTQTLLICPVVYAEVSIAFTRIEELENALARAGFRMVETPREALFLGGKAFLEYRRRKGPRIYPLPDFFIGAHAAVMGFDLVTRDPRRYRSYFPTVRLICPAPSR